MPGDRLRTLLAQINVGIAECEVAETAHRVNSRTLVGEARERAAQAYLEAQTALAELPVALQIAMQSEVDKLRVALLKLSRLSE